MMNQETYVNINDLRAQGWTIIEIADHTGFHRDTISKYLKEGPPPAVRVSPPVVMTDRWRTKIEVMLESFPRLQGISVHNRLRADGFEGSYPTVVRAVRDVRGPRFKAAAAVSVPIHTDPGEEAQFDFCVLPDWAARFGWPSLYAFGMILSWSRVRLWWFTTGEDREHTFEGVVRFFEMIGGIPTVARTDRMGALGRSQGRRFVLHPPAVGFAAHHGFKLTSCQAGDAKRKGKVERPFRSMQETFLPEIEADGAPATIDELNARAAVWLDERVHQIASRATGVAPSVRFEVERLFLSPLPAVRFDTDYVDVRRVHNILPLVSIDANRYSVPPDALGAKVEIRRAVDSKIVQIRLAGRLVAEHRLVGGRGIEVWDLKHRAAAEAIALRGPDRPDLRVVINTTDADDGDVDDSVVGRLELGGDYDVAPPDLDDRYPITPAVVDNDEGIA